jgi:KaiC/GvpD/RAD55 family RecA-like ATPase
VHSEQRLLGAMLKSRVAHDKIADKLKEEDLTEQSKLIVRHVSSYYARDPNAASVDTELLLNGLFRELPNPKHHRMFSDIVTSITGADVSPENIVADYLAVKRDKVGSQLATALAALKPPDAVRPLLEQYEELLEADTLDGKEEEKRILSGHSVADLVAQRTRTNGLIRVFPRSLNDRLDGGLLRGHHVVVFARPEVGKTTFLVNGIYGFLKQELRVLYVGNEDPIEDVALRVVCRLSDMTRHEVMDDPNAADARARELGYERLIMASLAPGTPREIETLVKEHKPDVLMVDQLRNLLVGEDNFTRQLEKAAQAVRAIGKRNNCLVISVTQAGDSASGKSILDMGDVDSSNTGIPAQADVMIGIGMSREDEMASRRVLSLPKNKAGGNHDSFPVWVDLTKAKVRSA